MLALVLAAALASGPGFATSLPPAPVRIYRVAWQRSFVPLKPLERGPEERGGVAVDPVTRLAVFGTRDGWLHAVRPDGTVAWELRGGGPFGPPAIEGDTVYVGTADGRLYAVVLANGRERWRYQANEDLTTRPAIAHGHVFVASQQDTVFAVDAATGAWRWHHRRENKRAEFTIFGAAAAIAGPDAVYAGYSDGWIAALDPATGAARWARQVAPADDHLDVDALALAGGRLYAAAYSGAVLGLDAATGEARWTFQAQGAAQLALAEGLLVAVTPGNVHGLAPASGEAVWTAPLRGSPAGAPAIAGPWILVPAGEGGLRWIEAASGRTLRVFDPGTGVSGTPGVSGARIYVLSNGGDLLALDLT
jgi:outer membrane protein assembly factor BamB